ncbi:MAG: putative sulfate exporter family transporter [Chloroflexota bacterium]
MPGLSLVLSLWVAVELVAPALPRGLSAITLGVAVGITVGNLIHPGAALGPGVGVAQSSFLRLGIVLLGARLSFPAVVETGVGALVIIVTCMTLALVVTMLLARRMDVPFRLAALIAVGTAVCGNSAIVAVAPVIGASKRDISFAVAVITLFGFAAVLVYPAAGEMLGLSDSVLGHWAGAGIHDTSQVTAAGFAYSEGAGEIATIVKLTRNTLLGPLIVILGWIYARSFEARDGISDRPRSVTRIPLFVVGFMAMAILNSLGLIPASAGMFINEASAALILAALIGVGLGTDLRQIRSVGAGPLYLGMGVAALVGAAALALSAMLAPP